MSAHVSHTVSVQLYKLDRLKQYGYHPTDDGNLQIQNVDGLLDLAVVMAEIGPADDWMPNDIYSTVDGLPVHIDELTLKPDPSLFEVMQQCGYEVDYNGVIKLTWPHLFNLAVLYNNAWVEYSMSLVSNGVLLNASPSPYDNAASSLNVTPTGTYYEIVLPRPIELTS